MSVRTCYRKYIVSLLLCSFTASAAWFCAEEGAFCRERAGAAVHASEMREVPEVTETSVRKTVEEILSQKRVVETQVLEKRPVWELSEDDFNILLRIVEAGYRVRLFPAAWVYHKRRTSLWRFFHQVRHSGEARIWLSRSHPGSLKAVHCLPAVFVLVVLLSLAGSFFSLYCAVPLAVYSFLLFIDATSRNKGDLWVGFLSTLASFTQLLGYGTGFWRALTRLV